MHIFTIKKENIMIFCFSERVKELQEKNTHESIIDYSETYIENLGGLVMEEKNMVGIKSLAFRPLKKLGRLELNRNQIESIEKNAFTGLDNLEKFRLIF